MKNAVLLIGFLKKIDNDFIVLDVENLGLIKVFVDNNESINKLILNSYTRVEGELAYKSFPFPIVVAKQIYQAKIEIN